MSEKGDRILDTLSKAIPGLTEKEKDNLLFFSEVVAFLSDNRIQTKNNESHQAQT